MLLTNDSFSICLKWLKDKTYIRKSITYIRKKKKKRLYLDKCYSIKNLLTLGWKYDIVVNEIALLSIRTSHP